MVQERLIDIIKCFKVNEQGTIVVVIPKMARDELNIVKGTRFQVKIDGNKRLIYERL